MTELPPRDDADFWRRRVIEFMAATKCVDVCGATASDLGRLADLRERTRRDLERVKPARD